MPAPASPPGASVTPGASNAEGSWVQLASAANIANDVYALALMVGNGATSGQSKPHLLDIGEDPAGGTSYTALLSNLACGGTELTSVLGGGIQFYFPLFIKAGSSVAARI